MLGFAAWMVVFLLTSFVISLSICISKIGGTICIRPFLSVCILYYIWCLSPFQLSICFGITGDNTITSPSLILYPVPAPSCRLSSYPLHQSLIHNLSDRLFFCRHNQSVWQCKQSLLLPVSLFLHQQETTINTDRK